MHACQTLRTWNASSIEQTDFIYLDLDCNYAGFRTTAVENGVEITHEEKKFSGTEKISRAKNKNKGQLSVLQGGGPQADYTAT